ncbi:MAG: tetratricopeptide repeat protein [candidate division WOR-3 bacterium]|nr:MAG: tetratricopeptide repeat protein [candidate division WOR-3 bacterium]
MILLLLVLNMDARIDSLENSFEQNRQIETLLELSKCYIAVGEYHKSIELLKRNERYFINDLDKAQLMYESGNVYLFAGEIVKAHDIYLRLISSYPKLDVANDAAERLYLIETAQGDTVQLKRLINMVRMYETNQYRPAVDSARQLLKTPVGVHAYYYLARVYNSMEDVSLALGALVELNKVYPEHRVIEAYLVMSDLYAALDKNKEAREILEDLIVREPNSIYAVKARQRLEKLEE